MHGDRREVNTVNENSTTGRIVEAGCELGQGRLTRAGWPYECDAFAGGNLEVDVLQHWTPGNVAKGDVFKGESARDGWQRYGVRHFIHRRGGL